MPGDLYDENGQLLLSRGHVPASQEQLDKLVARGLYMAIDVFDAHYKRHAAPATPLEPKQFDPFFIRRSLRANLSRMLYAVAHGSASSAEIGAFADAVQAYAEHDGDAALAACLLDRQDDLRAAAHSLSVAVLVALLGRRLAWPAQRRRSVVCAALTMNVGMLDLQQRLARQASPLSAAQRELVHAHPAAALAALQKIGVGDALWLAAVAEHHEQPGGNGYPQALRAPGVEGQLLRLVDGFLARASARADRPCLAPAQVIRELFVGAGQGACAPLVAALIKAFGLLPPGSFVKLASGELAVVLRAGEDARTPVVATVTNAGGAPIMQPVRRDTARETYAIAGTIVADKVHVGFDLGKLWLSNAKNA